MSWVKTNVEGLEQPWTLLAWFLIVDSSLVGRVPKKEVLPALCWSQVKICLTTLLETCLVFTLQHQNLLLLGTSETCKYRQDKGTESFQNLIYRHFFNAQKHPYSLLTQRATCDVPKVSHRNWFSKQASERPESTTENWASLAMREGEEKGKKVWRKRKKTTRSNIMEWRRE